MFGTREQPEHREAYCQMIRMLRERRRNVVMLRHDDDRGFGDHRTVHVWWGGLQRNGGLMMVLAYLLRTSLEWKDAQVSVKLMVPNEEAGEAARVNLEAMISRLRVGAVADVLVGPRERVPEVLARESAEADLVFLGLAAPDDVSDFPAYYGRLLELSATLPTTVFVLASEELDFAEVLA